MDSGLVKRPFVADISKEKDGCPFQINGLRSPQYWNEGTSAPQLVHRKDGEKTKRRPSFGLRRTKSGKWAAEFRRGWLGSFETAKEAARAYLVAVLQDERKKAKPNFPERVFNSKALLDPIQALHIGPPPHPPVVPTLSAAIGGPVPNNFNNVGTEMLSHFLINPTPNYGHMDPHMSNIRQQVNPSDVSPQNEDLQTFFSELVDDFTKWEESEQSSAQFHVEDPTLGNDHPTNFNDASSDQEPEEFWRSVLANNPL